MKRVSVLSACLEWVKGGIVHGEFDILAWMSSKIRCFSSEVGAWAILLAFGFEEAGTETV